MTVKTITNNHWRKFLTIDEIPCEILKADFDYLESDQESGFIKYKNNYYHLSEFMAHDGYWNACLADSAFSGLVIKISNDGESYKIARQLY